MGAFQFKQFAINDGGCGMKLSTDSVLLGAWADVTAAQNIVDLGCGSGILCLMAAQRNARARIVGIEIDAQACFDAKDNVRNSPWEQNIEIICGDAMAMDAKQVIAETGIDMIISNPPFFVSTLKSPDALRAQARHANTLSPAEVLAYAAKNLSAHGSVAMIYPSEMHQGLIFDAELRGLKLRRECRASAVEGKAPYRVLAQFGRDDGIIEKEVLSLRHKDGTFTNEYIELTKSFYLKF